MTSSYSFHIFPDFFSGCRTLMLRRCTAVRMGFPRSGHNGSPMTRRAKRGNPRAPRTACPGIPAATSEITFVPMKNNTTAKVTFSNSNLGNVFTGVHRAHFGSLGLCPFPGLVSLEADPFKGGMSRLIGMSRDVTYFEPVTYI